MKNIYKILLIGLLFAGIAACENETKLCDQTLSANLHVKFKRDSTGIIWDTTMPKVTVFALGHDSIYKVQPLSELFLQLSPVADISRFYLKVDSTLTPDTLTFKYKRTTHFISPGCGFGTYFFLDTVLATRHTIDSVQINNKSVTTSNDTHLTLYFFH
jgi:hypothetical protein